jgi:hypothetical protein
MSYVPNGNDLKCGSEEKRRCEADCQGRDNDG